MNIRSNVLFFSVMMQSKLNRFNSKHSIILLKLNIADFENKKPQLFHWGFQSLSLNKSISTLVRLCLFQESLNHLTPDLLQQYPLVQGIL